MSLLLGSGFAYDEILNQGCLRAARLSLLLGSGLAAEILVQGCLGVAGHDVLLGYGFVAVEILVQD